MAKETVQAVRKAEISAEKMERDALQKKEAIISEAQQQARELLSSSLKKAQEKADNDTREAVRRSDIILEEAREEAKKEVLLLIEMAKTKEQAAISMVISNVL